MKRMVPTMGRISALPAVLAVLLLGSGAALAFPPPPLFWAGPPGAAPPTPAELRAEVVRRGSEQGLTRTQLDALIARADGLDAEGLPSRAVLDRVLQGLAKGAPFPRILAVTGDLEQRIVESGRRVDTLFPRAERQARFLLIDNGAYALGVGVPGETLNRTMLLAREERRDPAAGAPAVLALGTLVSSGIDPDQSFRCVETAWSHGYRGGELERFGIGLAGIGRAGGRPPQAEIDRILGMIRRGIESERVLRDLDDMRSGPPPGSAPPGMRPGEDPGHLRGPGGPPQDPGHQEHGGGGHEPPPPPPPDHHHHH